MTALNPRFPTALAKAYDSRVDELFRALVGNLAHGPPTIGPLPLLHAVNEFLKGMELVEKAFDALSDLKVKATTEWP